MKDFFCMFIFLHSMFKLLNTHINILYYDQPDPKIYIHQNKIKIHQHFIAFNLIYLLILIEKSNRSGRSKRLSIVCLDITTTARFHYYYYSLYFLLFFLILNHAIFIIPFANHRWLCKHEKGVEGKKLWKKKWK